MISNRPDEDDDDEDDLDEEDVFGLDEKAFQADRLFSERINSWTGRIRGDEKPYTFAHWTKHGTLRMEPVYLVGMLQCQLMLDARRVATFAHPNNCLSALIDGTLDKDLGFSPLAAHVPEDLRNWGTFKA